MDATVAAPPAGGGAGGNHQQMNETGGRSVLFQKKRNGNKSVTIPSIPTISTAEKEANTTFNSTAADDGDDLNGSKTVRERPESMSISRGGGGVGQTSSFC